MTSGEHRTSYAALLTPHGRGAVATIAYEGDLSVIDALHLFRPVNGRALVDQIIDRIVYGHWGEEPAGDVVVCRTAGDSIEINCHGGLAASTRILTQLESAGAIHQSWHEWIERTEGSFAADVAAAFAAAATPRAAEIIAHQAYGPLRETFARVVMDESIRNPAPLLTTLENLNHWSRFGLHLTTPWEVVLYGDPNVGKSSLINALVGYQRAIVLDQPGTTRDVVTAETAVDGWPIRLSDTAGIRSDADELEAEGILRAQRAIAAADLRVLVLDRNRLNDEVSSWQQENLNPHLVVLNKCDLGDNNRANFPGCPVVAVSAKTGKGIKSLLSMIATALVPLPPDESQPVPITRRQIETIQLAIRALRRGENSSLPEILRRLAPRRETP